ncbi:MAG: alpha/beta hydrolase [bacterium]|nr:alpha/beta hydrolase [bacterium]
MRQRNSRARYLFLLPAVLILSGFLGFIENFFLYHPRRDLDLSPALYKIPFEEVRFRAADGTDLHGWFIPPAEVEGPVLLWAHGNAGNISHRSENAAMIRRETGAGMFLFDYRGYGKSAGRPGEEGLYADGRAAYAWLKTRVPPERIFLFGRSLGAAVTVKLAAEGAAARGLILESPFLSLLEMAQKVFPVLPVGWIVSQKFDNRALLPRVKMPIFILHGDADGIVPFAHGERLFEIAPAPKRFFRIKGAGHNDTYLAGGPLYWDAWRSFLRKPD